ncbi:MAG: bi-domain-containing oxidoreductase [Candidatus Riflebacteria bacterium]|nr:bi-domain-containing oxidoreductase [Candidatus Riflebacteria bacterium]
MKQILQSLKDGKIEVADIPVPAVKSGHLLIKTSKTLISLGTERMLLQFGRSGWIDKARQQPDQVRKVMQKIKTDGVVPTVTAVFNKLDQPLPLGYCNAGVVLEAGPGVYGFAPGDRVVSNGNHAEVVCIPQNLCAHIPDNVDDATAAFTVLAAIALEGVRLIEPTLGERIAILGLGLIGLLTGQILRANGCRVIGFDFDEDKVRFAKEFGIEAWSLKEGVDPIDAAMRFSDGFGVDGVIITAATKSNDPIHQAPQMCRKRGKVVLVGVVGLEMSRDDFYKKEISFQVSCSYGPGRYDPAYEKKGLDYPIGFVRWTEQRNFEAILGLMAEGRLIVKNLISETISIEQAEKAYELVEKRPDILGLILDYPRAIDLVQERIVTLAGTSSEKIKSGGIPVASDPIVGFIGAGGFSSSTLLPAFQEAGANLKVIASAGGVSGTHLGKKFKFTLTTTDNRYVFDDPELNTVVITTQHSSHASLVIQALRARKHVFVEKPLCLNHQELLEIRRAYDEFAVPDGHLLMVGFNRRFAPLVATMKQMLEGVAGPKAITMTVNAGAIPADHWTQDGDIGGGRILGEACHFIDLLRYLAGSQIKDIHGLLGEGAGPNNPPDTALISMRFVDGSVGAIQYFPNGHKDFPKERIEVFAGGRILHLDNFRRLEGFGWPNFTSEKPWQQDKGHKKQVVDFLTAIREGKPAPIPFDEIIEVTEATIKAAGIASIL